ncbi:hypothetical protein AB0K60_19435 [Thermopolyspora sp. NPDC052614]|uniref:hypothetical protein n=1 Tax=Thermopolyspora sp. NPDC052614 TaxID=3155682 RepID=UPI003446DAD2
MHAYLERLRLEILKRGWAARLCESGVGLTLHVRNPNESALTETIGCEDGRFLWSWGQAIGLVSDVTGVADRILHVLRDVSE